MMETIATAIVLATAFPVGYLLAYLCKDELKAGIKYFKIISLACLAGIFVLFIAYRNFPVILTLAYISIICFISVHKSNDKKVVK